MHWIDYTIFGLYMVGVLGVGFYHMRRNTGAEDYYVGGRQMGSSHIGLSIVATDVGGGFSIGLGGLGFAMGLSGSWLLFTGLVGAWLSAVFVIPRLKRLDGEHGFFTYPDFLRHRYGGSVALLAALISGLGYMGFTGAQILAGAKLASGTFLTAAPLGLSPLQFSLYVIAFVTILYTVAGGLKAVVYTDTVQWVVLLAGLILVTIPSALQHVGGWSALRATLPPEFFTLDNVSGVMLTNWMVTIIPIWLIAMTLYQRAFACRDTKEARRAWYVAGLFEYPVMAFTGVLLGMCARVVFPDVESEMGLPMLIQRALPVGVTGVVIASYFSAIMSTADSCLMASSGNLVNDILQRYVLPRASDRAIMRVGQVMTLLIGVAAIVIAARFEKVLDAILFAYSFMVSGLFVPTLGAYFWPRGSAAGALTSMLAGGGLTLAAQIRPELLPSALTVPGLDPTLHGIVLSAVVFVAVSLAVPDRAPDRAREPEEVPAGRE